MVTGSADIAIIARGLVEKVEAPGLGIARIMGARVLIVARQQARRQALPIAAVVAQGAGIVVITLPRHGLMETPPCGRTTISSTLVTVVAHQRVASHTGPIDTAVTNGAGIPILAGARIGGMHAAALGVTRVIGADIVIGAVEGNASHALTILTGIAHGARVLVLTGLATI